MADISDMPPNEKELDYYEVGFTVSPGSRTETITRIKPNQIFQGPTQENVTFKVRAGSEEDAEEAAFRELADSAGPYVKKYGQGFEVKTRYVWRLMYL
jgi:hypothetical protein